MVRYLITSGTSKTGAATIKRLVELGVPRDDIYAGTRDPIANESRLKAIGAGHVVQLDHSSSDSIEKALVGIDRVGLMQGGETGLFNIYSRVRDIISRPGSSVKSIVAIGGTIGGKSDTCIDFETAEKVILETPGIATTIVAPNWFMENWQLPEALQQIEETGVVHGAAKDGKIAYIAVRDIGNVIAQVLFDDPLKWNGQRLYITGPEAFTEQEILSVIGKVVYDKEIQYKSLEPSAFGAFLTEAGTPAETVKLLVELEQTKVDGYTSKAAPHMVKLVTGRDATSLAQWATEWASQKKRV
jgi:uncharacterized protein YbjT (DUF2867 family)